MAVRFLFIVGCNLWKAELQNADLSYAQLEDASLELTHLQGVHLCDAHLKQAGFHLADLTKADLFGADFTSAGLTEARLFGASIDELTVFEKANWWEANFKSPPPNAKLREVCAKDGDEMDQRLYQWFSKHWPKPAEDTGFPDFIMDTGRYRSLGG